jgi:hypothetical protein
MSHACPVRGCKNVAKLGHLMCWPHWRRVPRFLKSAVWETCAWYNRVSDRAAALAKAGSPVCSIVDELGHTRARYEKAAADAIAAVEAKEAA